jgi:hypothetical protein
MKRIAIEDLLRWAFTVELPKKGAKRPAPMGFSHSMAVLDTVAELGTLVDGGLNSFGVVAGFVFEGEPHADAVAAYDAVMALDLHGGFEIGEGWNPFPEWQDPHGLIAAEVAMTVELELARGDRLNARHVVGLVKTAAILGRGPDWEADEPVAKPIKANGKDDSWFIMRERKNKLGRYEQYEDNGFDARNRRPLPNAYRKLRLTDPLRATICARQDWQIWQSALETLAATLPARLRDHQITPFAPNRQPWLAQPSGPAVLQTLENAKN